MKVGLGGLLKNKMVLYLVLFLSLVSLFNFLTSRNYRSLLIFLVVALLVNCFNKNMTLVLGCALVLTHLLTPRQNPFGYGSLLENMENKEDKKDDDNTDKDHDNADKKKKLNELKKMSKLA